MRNPIRTKFCVSNLGKKKNSSECYKCHKIGHFARECTSSEHNGGSHGVRGGGASGNRGGYRGGRGGGSRSSPRYYSQDSNDSDDSESNNEAEEDSQDSDHSDDSKSNNEAKEDVQVDSTGNSTDGSGSDSDQEKQDKSEDSESDDETESDDESSSEDKDEEFDHKWEEFRNEAPDTDEITRRIAVCNMDWDRIRAVDLLACFNSFKPADGIVNSVKIYPSEYGLQRMEEEKLKGPPELVEKTLPVDQEEVEDKNSSKYHREKLRQYQLNRLKYYYAVVECDSPETANTIYEQLNGMEYESSSVRFDLRCIPDDMTFDHKPTSVAEQVPSEYKPRLFVTSALQQVKVNLTWDETDPRRREFFQKVFTDFDSVQDDVNDYLASASSESEDEPDVIDDDNPNEQNVKTKDRIAKYKDLLKSIEEKEKKANEEKIDVEITWEPALEAKAKEKVKERMQKESLNPFEEMLLKKKEQKKMKKKEFKKQTQDDNSEEDSEEEASEISDERSIKDKKLAELALISDYKNETDSAGPSSLKKKKKKEKSDELDGFVADMNDPRFSAMHTSSLFNVVSTEHNKKNDRDFSLKRPKEKKFKHHGFQKNNKKAKYH